MVSYLQLAENVWDPERRRSQTRVVHNCGRADDPAVTERLRKLAASILRRCSVEDIAASSGGDLRLVCAWPYGEVYVLQALWQFDRAFGADPSFALTLSARSDARGAGPLGVLQGFDGRWPVGDMGR